MLNQASLQVEGAKQFANPILKITKVLKTFVI